MKANPTITKAEIAGHFVTLEEMHELMTDEQKMFLDVMTPMNIEAHYPDYKSRIAASLNEKVCQDIIEQTEQMQSWIKSKL